MLGRPSQRELICCADSSNDVRVDLVSEADDPAEMLLTIKQSVLVAVVSSLTGPAPRRNVRKPWDSGGEDNSRHPNVSASEAETTEETTA